MHARKTKTLGIFQAVPLYYAALAVKREQKMNILQRNAAVVTSYKYAAGAFLEWLYEKHDFRAPSWLTVGVMGCTTLSPQGKQSIQTILHTRYRQRHFRLVPEDSVVSRIYIT